MVLTRRFRPVALLASVAFAFAPSSYANPTEGRAAWSQMQIHGSSDLAASDEAFSSGFELFYAGPQWFLSALSNPGGTRTTRARLADMSYDSAGNRIVNDASYVGTLTNSYLMSDTSAASPLFYARRSSTEISSVLPNAPTVATDGTWIFNTNSTAAPWSLTTNWSGGVIADGGGFADFSTINITGARNPNIDTTSRTVRRLDIGDTNNTHSYTISATGGGTLIFDNTANSANAQLNQTVGSNGDTISAPIVLNSSLDVTNAAANALTLSTGGITAGTAGTKTITTSTGNVTLSGVIGDGSGAIALVQNGPGSLTLSAINTYSGNTTIAGGKINLNATSTLGNGAGTLFLSGGTLNTTNSRTPSTAPVANNVSVTANSAITTTSTSATVDLNFTGTLTGSGGTLTFRNDAAATTGVFSPRLSGGTFAMARPIVVDNGAGGGSTLLSDFNTTGTTHTFDGIISGNGSFSRNASTLGTGGTTIFNANNIYTGTTTANRGTLLINGDQTAAIGAVAVNNSGTLGGTGTIGGAVTVNSGGIITGATNGTVGTLTLASTATFSGASGNLATYLVDISGASSDKLAIAGSLSLAGAFDQITFNGAADGTSTYVLATYSSVTGTFDAVTGLPSGYSLVYGASELDLVPVPEPSTWIGAALALGAIGFTQRRRLRGLIASRA